MASVKNRNTFRAINIEPDVNVSTFRDLLLRQLTKAEKKAGIIIPRLDLAPSPCQQGKRQTAIFQFYPATCTPEFLKDVVSGGRLQIQYSDNKWVEIDADFYGITQLYSVSNKTVQIDIVAITGVNGHAFGSWTGAVSPKIQKPPMWLSDFLSGDDELKPYCRSMIYGYNSKHNAKAENTTEGYVQDLLDQLLEARSRDDERYRPLIFIGHSYGGIITAEAFMEGLWNDKFESIYHSMRLMIGFGIPYYGINFNDVGEMVASNPKEYDQGNKLFAEVLQKARGGFPAKQFKRALRKRNIKLVSFYETSKTKAVIRVPGKGGLFGSDSKFARAGEYVMVVAKTKAVLGIDDLEEEYRSEADHSAIVKFTVPTNRSFNILRARLRSIILESHAPMPNHGYEIPEPKPLHLPTPTKIVEGVPRVHFAVEEAEEAILENIENIIDLASDDRHAQYLYSQLLRLATDANLELQALRCLNANSDPNFRNEGFEDIQLDWVFDISNAAAPSKNILFDAYQKKILVLLQSKDSPLLIAVKRGHARIAKILLERNADTGIAFSKDDTGWTVLHQACKQGDAEITRLLLENGAFCDAKSELTGATPLHEAVENGSSLEELLLKAGADVNAKKAISGDTALHIAARMNLAYTTLVLMRNGADASIQNTRKATPLHDAAKLGHEEVVKWMLSEKGNTGIINIPRKLGYTALHEAASGGHATLVQVLLGKGADQLAKTSTGKTALDIARSKGYLQVVGVLETAKSLLPTVR